MPPCRDPGAGWDAPHTSIKSGAVTGARRWPKVVVFGSGEWAGRKRAVSSRCRRTEPASREVYMDSCYRRHAHWGAVLATLMCMPAASWAAFAYDEAVDGDLSGDGLS